MWLQSYDLQPARSGYKSKSVKAHAVSLHRNASLQKHQRNQGIAPERGASWINARLTTKMPNKKTRRIRALALATLSLSGAQRAIGPQVMEPGRDRCHLQRCPGLQGLNGTGSAFAKLLSKAGDTHGKNLAKPICCQFRLQTSRLCICIRGLGCGDTTCQALYASWQTSAFSALGLLRCPCSKASRATTRFKSRVASKMFAAYIKQVSRLSHKQATTLSIIVFKSSDSCAQ